MHDFQVKALQKLKCFQIVLTFKRVSENIIEFEINIYVNMFNLSMYFFLKQDDFAILAIF